MDADAVDRLFALYDGRDRPGAAVAVFRGGRIELGRVYGAARLDPELPIDLDTAFRLASLTKQFTAKAVAMLIEDRLLSLDTPIRRLLPELPGWAEEVRIGHLVAHTSGLPHYDSLLGDSRREEGAAETGRGERASGGAAPHQLTDRDVVEMVGATPDLLFRPGSRFDYNNGGYALLAMAVESVAGRSFGEVLEQRIFGPLGMRDTVAHVEGRTVVRRRALGYRASGAGFELADQGPTTAVLGDGGVYSTIRDLARWDRALASPGFAPEPAALAPYAAPTEEGAGYGFGWYLDRWRGRRRQRHDGWTTGFQNEMQRFPEEGWSVVVLTNRASPPVRELAERVAATVPGDAIAAEDGSIGGEKTDSGDVQR